MNTENNPSFGGLIGGIKGLFGPAKDASNGASSKASTGSTPTASNKVINEFDQALRQVREQANQLRARTAAVSAGAVGNVSTEAAKESLQKRIEEIHEKILKEILEVHAQLKTGITQEDLQSFAQTLENLEQLESNRGSSFEDTLKAALVRRVVSSSAELAWPALISAMKRADLHWPEPSGLGPFADAPAIARALERELADISDAFLKSSPRRIAHRMQGVVDVWKANYPTPDSGLWRQMVFQAVGYGLLGRAVAKAAAELKASGAELRAKVAELLKEQLVSIQTTLSAGISSVEDADVVARGASQICEEIVPEIAWEKVRPLVESSLRPA
jgi:hypothetical protein